MRFQWEEKNTYLIGQNNQSSIRDKRCHPTLCLRLSDDEALFLEAMQVVKD